MTLRKIHKRASVAVAAPNKRQVGVSQSSSTASTVSHGVQMPTGPPPSGTPTTAATSTPVTSPTGAGTNTGTGTGTRTGTATGVTSTPATTTATSNTSVPTTPPPSGSTRSNTSEAVVTRSVTSRVSSTSTRTSATATATSGESDGMSLGSIAGAAAAAIIGIGVITAFVIWFIRRRKRNSDIDEEPFNRNSFLRQSVVIPDDDAPPPSRTRPPPGPNMVERQPTPLYGAPNPYNDMGNDGFGYNTQPSYNGAPGQMYNGGFGPGGAPATPLPNTPGFGTTYDQGFNNSGGYAELTRGNTPHDYPPSPRVYEQYNHHLESPAAPSFAGRDGFPSPPPTAYGAETVQGQDAAYKSGPNYPELTPATATAQQGHVVTVKESAHDGRETPVQLGFAPAQTQPKAPAPVNKKQRPESSMYNEDDAYGGM